MKKIILFYLLFFIVGCTLQVSSGTEEEIKNKADSLWEAIATGNAEPELTPKFFPPEQTKIILSDLQYKCDFKNRKGNFLNSYYSPDKSHISLIYEYYLQCDSVRFILTYKLTSKELREFKLEPIEKDNDNITNQKMRLKF